MMDVFTDLQNMEDIQKEALSREDTYHVALPNLYLSKEVIPKVDLLKENLPKEDPAKDDLSKVDLLQEDLLKEDPSKDDLSKVDLLQEDLPKEDPSKDDLSKVELPKKVLAKEDLPKYDLPKHDQSKEDLPKEDISKEETQNEDLSKVELLKVDRTKDSLPIDEALLKEALPIEDLLSEVLLSEDLQQKHIPNEDLSNEELPNEDMSKEDLPKESLPTEDLLEEDLADKSNSWSLYVGNLNSRFSKKVLTCMLKDVLAGINVNLQRHDIEIIKKGRCAYAFVHLENEISYQCVLTQFQNPSNLEQSLFKELIKKGKTLTVADAKSNLPHKEGPEKESKQSSTVRQSSKRKSKNRNGLEEGSGTVPGSKASIPSSEWVDQSSGFVAGTKSESAIVRQQIMGKERLFFGAIMGSETRNMEFKRGGGEYLNMTLKHHVRKYTCAFLNSGGGSLLVGVEDSGAVVGVQCNHKDEDRVRLLIDSILKGFKPPLFPEAYSLTFIPVIKPGDTGLFLKVIRLMVHPPRPQSEPLLYETDQGEVYLRRDGSVQGPLSGNSIQEWCRQKWVAELKKLEARSETLLQEKVQLQKKLHSQSLKELPQQNQQDDVPKRKAKSAVCNIM